MLKLFAFSSLRYNVELEEGFDNILVVDGVPVIDNSKLDKLLTKINKEFGKKGAHIKPDNIFVPWDERTGKSKGWAHLRQYYELCPHVLLSASASDSRSWSSRMLTRLCTH